MDQVERQKGAVKLRWLILLGLIAGGAFVYAKESPSNFFVTSHSSFNENEEELISGTASSGYIDKALKRLTSFNDKETQKLTEPQSLTRKQEANFYEAAVSQISESGNEVKDRAAAVASCIEEAGKGE